VSRRGALAAVCVLFAAAAVASVFIGDRVDRLLGTVELARPLGRAIPSEHAGWRGVEEDLTPQERKTLLLDDYVRRGYRGPRGEQVSLFVSYYGNKERGLQRYYHNPTVCYPAAGWGQVDTRFSTETLHDAAKQLPVCRYIFEKGGTRISVLTFFRVDGEFLDQSPRNKPFWMLADRLTPDLDDSPGTFVQVQVIAAVQGGDDYAASDAQSRFLQAFGGVILAAVETGGPRD